MPKGFIATEILIPDLVHFFGPRPGQQKHSTTPKRQKLRGKLRLVTSRPIQLNRVEIRFKASSHLSWHDPLKSHHSILAERMHGWKTSRKSKSVLLEDATIPSGITEMGFELTLPGTLCSSYRSEYVQIAHTVYALILPARKFAKEMVIEREIRIHKTLIPKDVVYGYVDGYQVPRLFMQGKRPGCMSWEFSVPRFVCLEQTMEFDGILCVDISRATAAATPLKIDKIQVDVVQEELYRDLTMVTKRHLVICNNTPSVYLHPPLDTPISFSFPLQTSLHGKLHRTTSVPTYLSSVSCSPPSSSGKKIMSPNGEVTLLSHGPFSYSLDSPFLIIRHYIRLIVHIRRMTPVCIGLPVQITRHLRLKHEQPGDELPTYQSTIEVEEQLPNYTPMAVPEVDDNHSDSSLQCSSLHCDTGTVLYRHTHSTSHPSGLSSLSIMSPLATPVDPNSVLAEERTLEDFWIKNI